MNKTELLELIKTGEGLTLEFKKDINSNLLKSQIQSFARNIDPTLFVETEDVENMLVIHVPEGQKKPYSVNGQFFLRVGANSQQLNRDEIKEFFQKENLILFDNQPNKDFDSDIISNYNNALIYLFSKLNTNYIIKRERVERLELPEEALREALINAIVHRDYFSTGHVQIDIYFDRVEISNPGGLVKGLSMKDFGIVSLPRNPLIMDLMLRVQKVEKIGSGIKRINDTMNEYGLNVKFSSTGFFTVVFKRLATPQAELTELESKIVMEIKMNSKISRSELAKKISISSNTVKEYITKLKYKGVIKRVGKTSAGYWEVRK